MPVVDSVDGVAYVSGVMQLQPRRVPQWLTDWAKSVELKDGPPSSLELKAGLRRFTMSIWRMELPNESYRAPQSAFWWVSNEGAPLARLTGAGRA